MNARILAGAIPRSQDSLDRREAVVTRSHSRPQALRLMVRAHRRVDAE